MLLPAKGNAALYSFPPEGYSPVLTRWHEDGSDSVRAIVMPVLWRGRSIGSVNAVIEPFSEAITKIDGDSAVEFLTEIVDQQALEFLKTDQADDGTVLISKWAKRGVFLVYDEDSSGFLLQINANLLQQSHIALSHNPDFAPADLLEPETLSAFLNVRGGVDYVHQSLAPEGRQPARIDMDGAVNLSNFVLEGRVGYQEDSKRPWQRNEFRLVHDIPGDMLRLAAGDLAYPVTSFQTYQPMLGLSVAKNFDLQPYRVTEPSGNTSFILQSPSRVDVYVNNQRVRTLQLAPGPYDVSDFPLADGSNDVRLVITDAAGRTEEKTFPLLTDQVLLRQGLSEYSYNVGFLSQTADREIEYDFKRPLLSGFYRRGVTDSFTIQTSLQASQDLQQAGAGVTRAYAFGTLGLNAAASHDVDDEAGWASEFTYGYEDAQSRRSFSSSAEFRSHAFSDLADRNPAPELRRLELVARYSQLIMNDLTMGAGGRYEFMRGDRDDQWGYSLNLSKILSGSLTGTLNLQNRSDEGTGAFLGLTWVPGGTRHSVMASVDTYQQRKDLRWGWRDDRRWQVGAGASYEGDDVLSNGQAAYTGQRVEMSMRHDANSILTMAGAEDGILRESRQLDQRSQISAGTALVFAGGHMAVSRPVSSSFILVSRHDTLDDYTIGINPQGFGPQDPSYEAQADFWGPAVVADAVPYIYRPLRIDTSVIPPGYNIDRDQFVAFPGYKAGLVMEIGSAANIYADGYLFTSDGSPAAMLSGFIYKKADGAEDGTAQEFFTNREGRFRIAGLEPGVYELSLGQDLSLRTELAIPDNTPMGPYKAGALYLQEKTR